MTVTRYKRQPATADSIRDAVLGVMRTKEPAPAKPAAAAKPAPLASRARARSLKDIEQHHAKVVEKPPMKINRDLLARAKRRTSRPDQATAAPVNPFTPYKPAPGVLPDGAEPKMAMDSGLQTWAQESFISAWSVANPYGAAFAEGVAFLGYAYLSELTQRPEYRRISERISTEMTRKWIRLTIAGEADPEDADDDDDSLGEDRAPDAPLKDEEDEAGDDERDGEADADEEPTPEEKAQRKRNDALKKKIKKIDEDMKRLDVRGKFKTTAEFDGWMGRSHLYVDTGDSDDPDELLTNLGNGSDDTSKTKFKKGSLRALKHIEPIWCYPLGYDAQNPLSDEWYNPQVWFVMSKQVHVSRLLTFVGRPVPDILKPAYAFGGLSMSQMAKPYVDNWLRTRQAVTALIESFSVSGVYTNAQSLLQGGGEEVLDRIELFNVGRTNSGTMVLDKEAEEFFNISTPLGTLDHLQAQSQEQMSSVSGIPLIVLLGITPSGLNASSEGELRVFYDLIHAMQENLWRDKLKRVINFVQLNLFGEIDPAIGFEFEPLWSLDEKGEADVKKIEMETHTGYVDAGIIGQEEVRNIIVEDEDSPYNGLDPDDLPDPPVDDGMVPPGGGGGGAGSSSRADNKEVSGAADSAITEVADDVFAFDDGQFDESKHKRDHGGKFSTTGVGGGAAAAVVSAFKTKKEHIAHLLSKGTTPKELMQEMGWPSVSMPAQAKSLGMKLEKKDGKYFGTPMTDEEKAAVKAEAAKKPAIAKEVVSEVVKQNPGLEQIIKNAEKINEGGLAAMAGKPAPKLEPTPPKAKATPKAPQATEAELKKAQKSTTLSLNLVPGAKPEISGSPQSKMAADILQQFNDKYAGKELTDKNALNAKVQDFQQMTAEINSLGQQENAKKAEIQAEAHKKSVEAAKKAAAEAAVKQAAEKAKIAAQHKEVREALGIKKEDTAAIEAFDSFIEHFGGAEKAIKQFQSWQKTAEAEAKANPGKGYEKLSGFEMGCIKGYTGPKSGWINDSIINDSQTPAQFMFEKVLNQALDKLPKVDGKIVKRGLTMDATTLAKMQAGKVWTHRNFASSNAEGWSGNVKLHITTSGKGGAYVGDISSHVHENETLFKSNLRLLIDKVESKGGQMQVHCREI